MDVALDRIQIIRDGHRVIGGDNGFFSHPAVHGETRILSGPAQGLVTSVAVFTVAATGLEPGHRDPFAQVAAGDARSQGDHPADAFMADDSAGHGAEIPGGHVNIGVAQTAIFHFELHFTVTGFPQLFVDDVHVPIGVGAHYCCFHNFRHPFRDLKTLF